MQKLRRHWINVIVMLLALSACEQSPQFNALAPGATVLAFGDSVTYGVGAKSGEDFPTLLAAETGWNVINAGVSGDTARDARHRIDALLAQYQPQLVIVELGGNDFLRRRPAATVKRDLRQKGDRILFGKTVTTTAFEDIGALVTMRADKPAHVFNHTDYR